MSNPTPLTANPPARTHAEAAVLFRRPFAPGAIGFRAMTKVPYQGEPYSGAQVAAYLGAQSVVQRLNTVVPGRWRQQFQSVPAELVPAGTRRIYLACRSSFASCRCPVNCWLTDLPLNRDHTLPPRVAD
jgi:hypothetical protein